VPSWPQIARRIRVPLGFLFAGAYIWLSKPTSHSILIGSAIAFIGLTVRALSSGHVRKNEQLTMSGPYAYIRNPLYFGSIVMAAGFTIAARSWWIALIAAVFFFAIYFPVIRAEEEYLRGHFSEFEEYKRKVPRLFPRLTPYRSSAEAFSWHLYWKHREYNAALGSLLIAAILVAKLWIRQ
jgi:protein-S-isoprenylcysteine O-methyltransferase Ste14